MNRGHFRRVVRSLFATPGDSLITLVILALAIHAVQAIVTWAGHDADWLAVTANLRFLLAGTAPSRLDPQMWALWGALLALAGLSVVACLGRWPRRDGRHARRAVLAVAAALVLAVGGLVGVIGIAHVGGLLLSVLATALAALLSLPIGVLLALGRRSRLAAVQVVCTAYVELMRSLPLLLIIYVVWVAVPLLAPTWGLDDFFRGLAGLVLFFSAYVSEYVRSGLQSVPRGQLDAARALGLGPFDVNVHVVFPQALRVVVPTLVGNVLDIFNATPLLFIIGLTDFLRAGQLILASPTYAGREVEIYGALLLIYFTIGSVLTYASRRLERQPDAEPISNRLKHGGIT